MLRYINYKVHAICSLLCGCHGNAYLVLLSTVPVFMFERSVKAKILFVWLVTKRDHSYKRKRPRVPFILLIIHRTSHVDRRSMLWNPCFADKSHWAASAATISPPPPGRQHMLTVPTLLLFRRAVAIQCIELCIIYPSFRSFGLHRFNLV